MSRLHQSGSITGIGNAILLRKPKGLLSWMVACSLSAALSSAHAERTIHVFGVYCDAYTGESAAINGGVAIDKIIVENIFQEHVSPQAWGVKLNLYAVNGTRATRDGILSEFASFAEGVGADDTIYVHFSGHGAILNQASGEQFLLACDNQTFSREEWAKQIDALPCKLKILVTDCCSTFFDQFVVAEGDEPVLPWTTLYFLLLGHTGFVNITAAAPGQPAWGTKDGGYLTINLESDLQRFRTWPQVFAATQARVYQETGDLVRGMNGATSEIQKPFAYSLATPDPNVSASDAAVTRALEYVIADSNQRYLTEDEANQYGLEQLYLARNEIFGRHGYDFKSDFLRDYFSRCSWYQARPGFKDPSLSGIESANVELLLQVEKAQGGPYISGKTILPGDGGSGEIPDMFSYSSEQSLSRTILQSLSLQELSIARNEIYARHGYPFASRALQDHFARKSSYYRDQSATDPTFNSFEQHNIWLIEKVERILGGAYKW